MEWKGGFAGQLQEDAGDSMSVAAAGYEEGSEEEEPYEREFCNDGDEPQDDPLSEEGEASDEEPYDATILPEDENASDEEPFDVELCDEEEDCGEEDPFHEEPFTGPVCNARNTCRKQLYEVEPCDAQVSHEEFIEKKSSATQAIKKEQSRQEVLKRALSNGSSNEQKAIPVTDEMEMKPFKKRLSVRFAVDVSCYTYNTEDFGAAKLEKRKAQFDDQDKHCKKQEYMLPLPQDGGNEMDSTNLYVGNLPASVASHKLIELFLPFGRIVRSRVMDDRFTGLSMGYGFVKYADPRSAAAATKRMNGRLVDGKTLEVRVAGPPPSGSNPSMLSASETYGQPSKENGATNLYVCNLPLSMNKEKLVEHFLPFGEVTNAKVVRDYTTGLSKGYGFVKYSDSHHAAKAVIHLNGRLVEGKQIEVRVAGVPPLGSNPSMLCASETYSHPSKEIDATNLYVSNLPLSMNSEKLVEHFLPFGEVTNAKVVKDYTTGLSKGYGFVKYSDSHHAAQAVIHLNGHLVEGKQIEVRVSSISPTLSNSTSESHGNTRTIKEIDMANLYVCNIPSSIDTNKLVELFSPFGKITRAIVFKDQGTFSGKGYGFVKFFDSQSAAEAIALMNGTLIEGETMIVRVAGVSPSASSSAVSITNPSPEINKSRLYISNLPRSTTADKLVNLFKPFGQISKVVMNLEYSLVYYADVPSAITAVKHMDGYLIGGKRLIIKRSESCPPNATEHALSQSAGQPMKEIDMANVFVGRVPSTLTSDQLVELFRPFGQIVQARTVQCHGYGLVRYDNPSSAAAAIDHMDGYQIGGSTLLVRVSGLPGESSAAINAPTVQMPGNEHRHIDMTNLYVCHLPLYITTEKLIELFLPCGQITRAKVTVDRFTGVSKGFGFVKFADTYSAAVALTHMNGYPLDGHILEVRIKDVHPSDMSGYMAYFYSQFTSHDPSMTAVGIPTSYWPYYCAESAYTTPAENQGQGTASATDAASQISQQEGLPESISISSVAEKDCSSVSSRVADSSQPRSSAGWAGPRGFETHAVCSQPPSVGWAGPPGFEPYAVVKKEAATEMNPSQPCSKVHLAQSEASQKRRSIV